MRCLRSESVLFAIILAVACGCGSDEPPALPDGSAKAESVAGSSAQGFDTPDATLAAYGKSLVDGDGAAYRKIVAQDARAIAGLDAIIQLEKGMSPVEAERINLPAIATNQGFGGTASRRFPAEISGDNAVIVQLFERKLGQKTEIHFRKFKFTKSGSKWHFAGSDFGEAAELAAKYAWDKGAATSSVALAGQTPLSIVPQDAVAAIVVHPRRAASSETGKALLELDAVQTGLKQSQLKLGDIERVVYFTGIPTDDSESDCTVVQFTKPIPRATLLREEFGELPYEEVKFQGVSYFRSIGELPVAKDSTQPAAVANRKVPTANSNGKAKVLAEFPADLQPGANGHADSSDSGNWFYYSSKTVNPTEPNAGLYKLRWNAQRKNYVSPRGRMGNDHPTVGNGLDPSPFNPHYAVLRWQSRTAAEIQLRGNFRKFTNATGSDGVKALIFVDGEQKFSERIKPVDTVGVDFEISVTVKPGSSIDFVVDPNGSAHRDFTYLSATIEQAIGNAPADLKPVGPLAKPAQEHKVARQSGSAIYFPDDTTLVSTTEHRLRSMISGPMKPTPLSQKLAQLDLNHDVVGVVAFDGFQDQLADLLRTLTRQSGSTELGGLSESARHARFAVASIDLAPDARLRLSVEVANEISAKKLAGHIDAFMETLEGSLREIPDDSPMLPVVKQLLRGTTLKKMGLQVVFETKLPPSLAEFVRKDAAASIDGLTRLSDAGGNVTPPLPDPDPPVENVAAVDPKTVVNRQPPENHPEFRDLAVESLDCRVFFPGKPESTVDVVPIEEGNVQVANYTGETARARYMFEVYTYPKATVAKMGAKALLDETRDNLADAPTGRVVSSRSFTFLDSPALDFVYTHPDVTGPGQAHCRVVVRGNRVYLLEVEGKDVPTAEIRVFHESLAPFAVTGSISADRDSPIKVALPRLPLPDQAARDKALQLVRELYQQDLKTAKTAADKNALTEKVIARAREVAAPVERFALLDFARTTAAGAGGLDAVLESIAQLDDEFEVDSLQLTTESFMELANSTLGSDDRVRLAGELLDAAQSAVEVDRYDDAVILQREAATTARAGRDLKLAKSATDQLNVSVQLKSSFEAVKAGLETLNSDPNDATANQVVGEFYGLMKGQWSQGLPLLAKGNDAKLKSAAASDLSAPKNAQQQLALAGQWSELADAADGLPEKHLQLRAAHWYREALSKLSGLERDVIENKLSKMKHVVEAAGPKIVFLTDVPMLGAEGVLLNDGKGNFREERLKGKKYPQVLWAHPQDKAVSHYAFTLNRKYSQLTGQAAINDLQSVARATNPQTFAIYGDKRLLWKSRPLQDKLDSQDFTVKLNNVRVLHLYVSGGGYGGHALWVDVSLEEKQ